MRIQFILAILVSLLSFNAYSSEESAPPIQAILVSVKFLGGCGIFSQMAIFQESTKMAGGDEFILRFMNAEAARLGMTVDQYMAQCQRANDVYQKLFSAASTKDSSQK